ncbi:hypothetical protein SDC9_87888 [bioreactor metagenome]|uniref:Uncharacterized protein n=1 Tax=bioreactor metagenome TaxID=1076179 RepID=A0A644ZLL0_9ZZZZ
MRHGRRGRVGLGGRYRNALAQQRAGHPIGAQVFAQRYPGIVRVRVADQAVPRKHLAHDGLARGRVFALAGFQLRDGAVLQPAAAQCGHDGGGVPGGCANAAFQLGNEALGRGDEAHAQSRGDAFGERVHIDRDLWCEHGQRRRRCFCKKRVGRVFDDQQTVFAGDGDKLLPAREAHYPPQRIVHRGHGIDGAHLAACTQRLERLQIRPVARCGDGLKFQPKRFGEQLEACVGEGIDSHHIARLEQGHGCDGEAVLGAVHKQQLRRIDGEPAREQVCCQCGPVARPAGMWLVMQQ